MFLNNSFDHNIIADNLDKYGYAILNNVFKTEIIKKLNIEAKNKIIELNKKFSLNEKHLKKTIFEEVVNSSKMKQLFETIHKKSSRYDTNFNCHFLLNHTPSKHIKHNKLSFHFDAYKLTMIIPINTEDKNDNDHAMSLDIIPNIRKETNSMIINLIYKSAFQNKIFRKFSNTNFFNNIFKKKTLNIKYGELVIFNGFRSLHSASISKSRSQSEKTRLIIHSYNPFENNKINKIIFNRIQKNRDKKINDGSGGGI